MIIYWWTSTEVDDLKDYVIGYNGGVWLRMKTLKAGYLISGRLRISNNNQEEKLLSILLKSEYGKTQLTH